MRDTTMAKHDDEIVGVAGKPRETLERHSDG